MHTLWVDLGSKTFSYTEEPGYARYDYPSEASMNRVTRILLSDGFSPITSQTQIPAGI